MRLVRGRSEQTYTLLYGQAIRLTEATSVDVGHPLLVFTTYVAPRTADGFRRAETQYLDTAGNAWIHFGDLLVDIRGRSNPPGTRARVSGDLFSTGRAKVLFALLAWPQLWKGPQRDLAHAAGVSVGQANNTLHLLAEAGHGPAQGRHGQTDLLDLWAAAFPTRLAERIRLAEYGGELSHFTKVDPDDAVFVSGESASTALELLRPATLTLYVEELDPRLAIENRWRASDNPNIFIRRKFWHAPDGSDAPLTGLRDAPSPLVYADLVSSANPRVRGVAKEWRTRFARSE